MRIAILICLFAQLLLAAPTKTVTTQKLSVENYTLVKDRSEINFTSQAKMFGITSDVKGRFKNFSGEITKATALSKSTVKIIIEAKSIDTDNARRDRHLRKKDFFEVIKYPQIIFTSKIISLQKNGQYKIDGTVTIKDKSTPLFFLVNASKKGATWEISGEKKLSRKSLGITYESPFYLPDVLDEITLDFKFTLTKNNNSKK